MKLNFLQHLPRLPRQPAQRAGLREDQQGPGAVREEGEEDRGAGHLLPQAGGRGHLQAAHHRGGGVLPRVCLRGGKGLLGKDQRGHREVRIHVLKFRVDREGGVLI